MSAATAKGSHSERSIRVGVLFATLAMHGVGCAAEESVEWRYRAAQGGVTLTANSLGVASRAAFYAARGFSPEAIQPYTQACGFSFGMQNGGATTLSTRLAEWRAVGADGRTVRLRLPLEWERQWDATKVTEASRIAFRWAQFQAENVFEPGDWIMGMATLDAPLPGSFRLIARYHDTKGDHEIVLENLACDREPGANPLAN